MIVFDRKVLEDGTVCFMAMQGEACLGQCCLRLSGDRAVIVSLDLPRGDLLIGEGLFRAAFHYAANRGAYFGVCEAQNAQDVAAQMRFETKNGCLCNDIPTLLQGSCGGFDKTE